MTLRRVATLVGATAVAAMLMLSLPGPANACSCAGRLPLDEAIEQAEWVFVGRQTGRRESAGPSGLNWGRVLLEIEVVEVFKGDVPDSVELRTGLGGGDCGIDFTGRDEVGFAVTPDGNGVAGVSSCGGSVRADELRLAFVPLPTGSGTGPPGFLVGTEIGPARVAVLDTAGELLTYAEGNGRLAAAAVCPGAKKIVEIVEPVRSRGGGELDRPAIEVRDLSTLAIEGTRIIDFNVRDPRPLNGRGWLFDLQCHTPNADFVTYLLPSGVWDARAGSNLPGPAQLHIWRAGGMGSISAGAARAVTVDPVAERFYAITGIKGTTLDTRNLAGQLLDSIEVPQDHVGWRLALSPDRSELAVLARDRQLDRDNWFYAEVNHILVIDLATGAATTHALPGAGFARLLEAEDDGYVAATSQWEAQTTEVSRLTAGEVRLLQRVPESDITAMVAVGPETIISARPFEGDAAAAAPVRTDLASGSRTPIEDLVQPRLAIALPPGAEILNLPPAPVATTIPPAATPPPTKRESAEQSKDELTAADPPPGAEPIPNDSTNRARGITTWIAALAAFSAAAVLVRTRRARKESPPAS